MTFLVEVGMKYGLVDC